MDTLREQPRWKTRTIAWIAAGALCTAMVVWLAARAGRGRALTVERASVTISHVRRASFQEYITINGTIEPLRIIVLDAANGGRVVGKFVEEGALVGAGDALIRLDNPALSLQVMSTQSSFLQAESMAKQTRLTFEQNLLSKLDQLLEVDLALLSQKRIVTLNRTLFDKGLIAKYEYASSQEKYETLVKSRALLADVLTRDSLTLAQLESHRRADGEMAKNYMALIEEQLAALTVRAPAAGRLTSFRAELGQSVEKGFRIGQIDNIGESKVRARIDEHYIARVAQGQAGSALIEGRKYRLAVATVYPQVTNGFFTVDMVFADGPPTSLHRGQTLRIDLELGSPGEATCVEMGPFVATTGGRWIFVVDTVTATALRRPIAIGRQNPAAYEVLSGLAPGERVITSGYETFGEYESLNLH